MNSLVSALQKVAQFPLSYGVALLLQVIVLLAHFKVSTWGLRGGLFTVVLIMGSAMVIAVVAIVQVMYAPLGRAAKVGLAALQGVVLGFLGSALVPLLLIVLFFGPGLCVTTFNSPSWRRSITIEDSCFMGCTHTVYQNHFIFERSLGEVYLNNGKFCNANPVVT
jgi:hypothetical protein